MQRDTAALNFSIGWREYKALPLVVILHALLIGHQFKSLSFNIAKSPGQSQRMQVSLVAPQLQQTQASQPKTPEITKTLKKVIPKKIIKKKKKKIAQKVVHQQPTRSHTKPSNNPSNSPSNRKLRALEMAKKNFNSLLSQYSRPNYPRKELRRGITGEVILSFLVKGNGEVSGIKIAQSSGNSALDQSAIDAARLWKFKNLGFETAQVVRLLKKVVYQIN